VSNADEFWESDYAVGGDLEESLTGATETRAKSGGATVATAEWPVGILYDGVNVVRPASLRIMSQATQWW